MLLEQVQLQASLLDLKANPARLATGVVLEARNAQGQGAVATALVQKGTLQMGDIVVAGSQWGRVKALLDERGMRLDDAGPSMAVEVVGLGGLPNAGDVFTVTTDDSAAREIAAVRQQLEHVCPSKRGAPRYGRARIARPDPVGSYLAGVARRTSLGASSRGS